MPKITRKRVSVFASPAFRFGGALAGVSGLFVLGSIFLGMSDKGAIDVTGKITGTDQSGFASPVNPNNNMAGVNGGLRPASAEGGGQVPETPAPTVEAPTETATSTATTTDEVASSTEETVINSGLTPAEETAVE